jgi:hypothetical protein
MRPTIATLSPRQTFDDNMRPAALDELVADRIEHMRAVIAE